MALTHFFPQSHDFFADFTAAAVNAADAATTVQSLMAGTADPEAAVARLAELEHTGDDITHRIFQAVGHSFVPPISRDDVQAIARGLDAIMDEIEEAGKRFLLYRLGAPSDVAVHLATVIRMQADELVAILPRLVNKGEARALLDRLLEIHRLENDADEAHDRALAALYDGATTVADVIAAHKWGEIYALLEDATDQAEQVAHVLEGIAGERS